MPGEYAIQQIACFTDQHGFVTGLKYFYPDGSLGGAIGDCSGQKKVLDAGEGGVFVGVKQCKGAWGGIKSLTFIDDTGNECKCGNFRTDMSSWDCYDSNWGRPKPPPSFCVPWLNPDKWTGYHNYFQGYQTRNQIFRETYRNTFLQWNGRSWGGRKLQQEETNSTELEVKQADLLQEVGQAKFFASGRPGLCWETCTYTYSCKTPSYYQNTPTTPWWGRAGVGMARNKKTLFRNKMGKITAKNNWHGENRAYIGQTPETDKCASYDGYYKQVYPLSKITATCWGNKGSALSDLQFFFNKCYCPACDDCPPPPCPEPPCEDTSQPVTINYSLGIPCDEVYPEDAEALAGYAAAWIVEYLDVTLDLSNSVYVQYDDPQYEPQDYDCVFCLMYVDATVAANEGISQAEVNDALLTLADDGWNLCEPVVDDNGEVIIDGLPCADFPDLFPDCDGDPNTGVVLTVIDPNSTKGRSILRKKRSNKLNKISPSWTRAKLSTTLRGLQNKARTTQLKKKAARAATSAAEVSEVTITTEP